MNRPSTSWISNYRRVWLDWPELSNTIKCVGCKAVCLCVCVCVCVCVCARVCTSVYYSLEPIMWEERGRIWEEGGRGEQTDGDGDGGIQVLLLRVPGAELGWAGLSDTPPSGGGKEEERSHILHSEGVVTGPGSLQAPRPWFITLHSTWQ